MDLVALEHGFGSCSVSGSDLMRLVKVLDLPDSNKKIHAEDCLDDLVVYDKYRSVKQDCRMLFCQRCRKKYVRRKNEFNRSGWEN
jgi:hypothetical protein